MNSMPPAPIFTVASGPGEAGGGIGSKYINIDEIFDDCLSGDGDLLLDPGTGGAGDADNGTGGDDASDVGAIRAQNGDGAGEELGVTPSVTASVGNSAALGGPAIMGGQNRVSRISTSLTPSPFAMSVLGGLNAGGASGVHTGAISSGAVNIGGGAFAPSPSPQQLGADHFGELTGFGVDATAAVEMTAGLATAGPGATGGRGGGVSVGGGAGGGVPPKGARQGVGVGIRTTASGRGGGARGSDATGRGASTKETRSALKAGLDEEDDEDRITRRAVGGGGKRPRQGGRNMTERRLIDRRERNREHAKRSRVRKKFLLESLQKSVTALKEENDKLRDAIRSNLGAEVAKELLEETETSSLIATNPGDATKVLDDPDYSLVKALQTAQQNFVITDPTLPDNPIVFASQGFLELTGYKLDQVLGRNCRFLQGPDTDPKAVEKIRKAIESGMDTSVCLRNYRVDGAMFWNQFFIAALRDSEGAVINYVGVQCKVDEDFVRAVQKKDADDEGEDEEDAEEDEERGDGDDKAV